MPAETTFSAGMPVEIGQIDRELKKLWEADAGSSTRASLMNLAVYCEGEEAMLANTELISKFTADHACRALVIAVEPESPNNRVQAWISAHCHMSRAGAKQTCCEQISFLLEGAVEGVFPNILFSNLDSDLPLYLWWQVEFRELLDEQLRTWVDRLIFDSASWSEWKKPFALLRDFLPRAKSRLTLCDLNWTRTLYLRQNVAQLFDDPGHLAHLDSVKSWSITHAPGFRSTACLLAGWLAAQVGWKIVDAAALRYTAPGGKEIRGALLEKAGPALSGCTLECENASFRLTRDSDSHFFNVEFQLEGGPLRHRLLPAGREENIELLDQQLMQNVRHIIYLRALEAAEPLFSA